jgi:hypothetical protein
MMERLFREALRELSVGKNHTGDSSEQMFFSNVLRTLTSKEETTSAPATPESGETLEGHVEQKVQEAPLQSSTSSDVPEHPEQQQETAAVEWISLADMASDSSSPPSGIGNSPSILRANLRRQSMWQSSTIRKFDRLRLV